jgi:dipeptidyl aminopeptidase/acylaminoacyl peptidase
MKRFFYSTILLTISLIAVLNSSAQTYPNLEIKNFMQGEMFTGFSPVNLFWSDDGTRLYFNWNPEMELERTMYSITPRQKTPLKIEEDDQPGFSQRYGNLNKEKSQKVFSEEGDIVILDLATQEKTILMKTVDYESNPVFNAANDKIIFQKGQNLYAWEIQTGYLQQLTDFQSGPSRGGQSREKQSERDAQDQWLYEDQLKLFQVLRERRERIEAESEEQKAEKEKESRPKSINTGQNQARNIQLSPDENYISYMFYIGGGDKNTLVPNFVTETGYTENINARAKVGKPYYDHTELYIYDIKEDTVIKVTAEDIPGIKDMPAYFADYPEKEMADDMERMLQFSSPIWSGDGKYAIVEVIALDNKDRWIALLEPGTGKLRLLDRQHDDAWIGGPGIGRWGGVIGWMPDDTHIYFQSEETGWSHLYVLDVTSGKKRALTKGKFEIYNPVISSDRKHWYFLSNKKHHGERHLYRMPINGGKEVQITDMEGGLEFLLNPDDTWIALRHSTATQPWEIYLLENREGADPVRITQSQTESFASYPFRRPQNIKFKATDGAEVPARLYTPDDSDRTGAAVIFVHGAGYLQNAHKWWSSYYREYMFHNFLVDHGYTVLDIDYRGSAGYGRDWRTAIYRHMGGMDLSDQIDGAAFLVNELGIDPARIGIYGGSYGGFITLMAMFTKPGTFAAGAALRSVTDWAHYNHPYTANILNTPIQDSIAYVKSSPIYWAEGLEGALLICHGMIDDNVHFQDVVRLAQKLIELGKENWEFAVYPVERHSFVEPTSWTDEYTRIFRLFEEHLK